MPLKNPLHLTGIHTYSFTQALGAQMAGMEASHMSRHRAPRTFASRLNSGRFKRWIFRLTFD